MDAPPPTTSGPEIGPSNTNIPHNNNNNMPPRRPQMRGGGGGYGFFGNPMMNFMMPGMMGGGAGGGNNPLMASLQYLQSLSYIVYSLGQMLDMIGMNANSIIQGYHMISNLIQKLIEIIKNSKFRLWMQNKSKKSKIVRFLFVFLSMVATSVAIRLFQFLYIYLELNQPPSHAGFPPNRIPF